MDKDSIEIVRDYTDRWPLLALRKWAMKTRILVVRGCNEIISNNVFDGISISVIVANSITLALEDPTDPEPNQFSKVSDDVFQILYTIEMCLKIFGMGFICGKHSYLRDSWNILDFIIVMSGYVSILF